MDGTAATAPKAPSSTAVAQAASILLQSAIDETRREESGRPDQECADCEYDVAIERIQISLKALADHFSCLTAEINQEKNKRCSIHRLPVEILCNILLLASDDPGKPRWRDIARFRMISSSFNKVIEHNAVFWTDVRLGHPSVHETIAKARGHPLHVTVPENLAKRLKALQISRKPFLRKIDASAARWKSLHFDGRLGSKDIPFFKLEMPQVEDFFLNKDLEQIADSHSVKMDPGPGRNFRNIGLSGFQLPWSSSRLTRLETLQLCNISEGPNSQQVYDMLSSSPQLKRLVFDSWDRVPECEPPPQSPIVLPDLSHIVIRSIEGELSEYLCTIIESPIAQLISLDYAPIEVLSRSRNSYWHAFQSPAAGWSATRSYLEIGVYPDTIQFRTRSIPSEVSRPTPAGSVEKNSGTLVNATYWAGDAYNTLLTLRDFVETFRESLTSVNIQLTIFFAWLDLDEEEVEALSRSLDALTGITKLLMSRSVCFSSWPSSCNPAEGHGPAMDGTATTALHAPSSSAVAHAVSILLDSALDEPIREESDPNQGCAVCGSNVTIERIQISLKAPADHLSRLNAAIILEKNKPCSIHRLPVEILCNILLLASDDPGRPRWRDIARFRMIARSFNNIIEHNAVFWTDVRLGHPPAQETLAKARGLPLHITVPENLAKRLKALQLKRKTFLRKVEASATRWKSLHFDGRLGSKDIAVFNLELPQVEDLFLDRDLGQILDSPSVKMDPGPGRHFRNVGLGGFQLPWSSSRLTRLRTLELYNISEGPNLQQIHGMLFSSPQLKRLAFDAWDRVPECETPPKVPIVPPDLFYIVIRCLEGDLSEYLCATIECPIAQSISLDYAPMEVMSRTRNSYWHAFQSPASGWSATRPYLEICVYRDFIQLQTHPIPSEDSRPTRAGSPEKGAGTLVNVSYCPGDSHNTLLTLRDFVETFCESLSDVNIRLAILFPCLDLNQEESEAVLQALDALAGVTKLILSCSEGLNRVIRFLGKKRTDSRETQNGPALD
ncbi:hypothetical protein FRB90_011771 [Tulasnella sp. 427]|nr:hypothetical protein FRB90_011771 [Tulasnella sp. 427]